MGFSRFANHNLLGLHTLSQVQVYIGFFAPRFHLRSCFLWNKTRDFFRRGRVAACAAILQTFFKLTLANKNTEEVVFLKNNPVANPSPAQASATGTYAVKAGLAQMLKGGVIMDVINAEQAKIAEDSGAVAVMALEAVPADIRRLGGVARMADPKKIKEIQETVSIPVMAKCRIGHFVEAQILEALEVDYIDESEVLTPADMEHHVDKWQYNVPFVCGARDLGEALRRIAEGAAMIRTKGEAGTGNIVEAVRHIRAVGKGIADLKGKNKREMADAAAEMRVPVQLVEKVSELGRLPVVNFAAGGIATPADAALCMQLGCDGVFVGSGIFKSSDPERRAVAVVDAVAHFNDAKKVAKASEGLGKPMDSLDVNKLLPEEKLSRRGI